MNLKNEKDRKSFCSVLLLVMALVLLCGTAMLLAKIAGANSKDRDWTKEVLAQIKPDAEKTQEYLQTYKKAAADLTKQNMFVPPADESVAPGDCTAIFGDEARIGDRWYKAGDQVGDARIESIEPTVVTLLFNEQRITRKPVLVAEASSRNTRNQPQNNQLNRGGRGQRGNARGGRGNQGGNIGGDQSPQVAERFQAFMGSDVGVRIQSMMDGQAGNLITNYMNASPEQRQVQIDQLRQQFQGGVLEIRSAITSGGQGQQQEIIIREE